MTKFKTTITEGVKCPNRLCSRVKYSMFAVLEERVTDKHTISDLEKALNDCIDYYVPKYPRCARPYVSKWFNQKSTWHLGVCASEAVHCRSGSDFLLISVKELEG